MSIRNLSKRSCHSVLLSFFCLFNGLLSSVGKGACLFYEEVDLAFTSEFCRDESWDVDCVESIYNSIPWSRKYFTLASSSLKIISSINVCDRGYQSYLQKSTWIEGSGFFLSMKFLASSSNFCLRSLQSLN